MFNRLLEIFLANVTIANICALLGATFFVATLLTRTMVPLRVSNMISNVFFMAFGALASDIRTVLVALLLLPINPIRLRQMLNLVKNTCRPEWKKPPVHAGADRPGDTAAHGHGHAVEKVVPRSGHDRVRADDFGWS